MNLLESFYSVKENTVTQYANGQNAITLPAKAKYVMAGPAASFPSAIVYSYDGVTVNRVLNSPLDIGHGVAFNGSLWVAVGAKNGGNAVSFATSIDGINWIPGSNNVVGNPFLSSFATCVAWNGSYWLAGGHHNAGGRNFMKSSDGYAWTGSPDVPFPGGEPTSITWNGSYWVAVGADNSYTVSVTVSSDGMTWTNATTSPFQGDSGNGVAWNGSIWVAVGQGVNSLAVSSDGMTWKIIPSPLIVGYGVAWNGSYFVAVGFSATHAIGIIRSYNGISWTPISLSGYTNITGGSVCWDGLRWVVIGENGASGLLATSTDGVNWNVNNTPGTAYGRSIAARVPLRNQDVSENFLGKALGKKMKGSIHEVLVYAADHDATQRKFIENYLQNKWFVNNYNPTAIAATKGLWLDANPANFVYSSGTTIQRWNDKSANHCDCSQNIVWAQPVYEFDSKTNRYGVRFGSRAVSNALNSSISPFGSTQTWSMVVVARFTQIDDTNTVFSVSDTYQTLLSIDGGATLNMRVGDQTSSVSITNPRNAFIYTSSVDPSGNWINYLNGSPVALGSSASPMTSASVMNLGWNTSSSPIKPLLHESEGFTGYIFEMLVFKTALSAGDQQSLEGYLAWKWGIQQYLGSRYSSAPPVVY
jgi:hypothetical protein